MKRIRYEAQVKAAIIAAAHEARKSGKTWTATLETAKQAGYKGTEGGLYQLVNASAPSKKAVAPKAAAPKATTGKKAKQKPAPAVSAPISGSLDISALVHKTVTDAVVGALEALLVSLKSGK